MDISRKQASIAIIVVHEIYGINQHMKDFCQSLMEYDFDVICPNLLGKKTSFDYAQEEVSYHHFMVNVGFTTASVMITKTISDLKKKYKKIYVIGFSVGATISWLCSENNDIDGIVGYYGSRIRNNMEITPHCPTLLFFPETEKSFHVDELIAALDKKGAETHKFKGKHGFSDPYSINYHKESAQKAFNIMIQFLLKHHIKY